MGARFDRVGSGEGGAVLRALERALVAGAPRVRGALGAPVFERLPEGPRVAAVQRV